MSDRDSAAVKEYLKPFLKGGPPKLGRDRDLKAPRFPGLIAGNIGFGEDMTVDLEASFIATLALRPRPPILFDRTAWQADDVREEYLCNITRWFGHSGLPLSEARNTEVVPLLGALQPERVYDKLAFDQVSTLPGYPEQLDYPTFGVIVTWRHRQFAQLVITDRLPHMRTTEFRHPNAVWSRLMYLFREYIGKLRGQSYVLLPDREQRSEERALAFALFERLLYMRFEEAKLSAAYRRTIHDRLFDPEHPALLTLEPGLEAADHHEQLLVRRELYHALLRQLHHRTVKKLLDLTSNNRS